MFRHISLSKICTAVSKGVFPGLVIEVSLKAAVCVVGHSAAVCRSGIFYRFVQDRVKKICSGRFLLPLIPSAVLAGEHRRFCCQLNRIHFEVTLKSVCCGNPLLL